MATTHKGGVMTTDRERTKKFQKMATTHMGGIMTTDAIVNVFHRVNCDESRPLRWLPYTLRKTVTSKTSDVSVMISMIVHERTLGVLQ